MLTRRNFCISLVDLVAAPYGVRNSGVLMPVRRRITDEIVWAINPNINRNQLPGYPPFGMVMSFWGKAPKSWLPFDGRVITKEQHPDLFKLANWSDFGPIKLTQEGPNKIPCLSGISSIKPLHSRSLIPTSGDGRKLFG